MKLRCLKILNFDYDNIARMVKMLNKVKECNKRKKRKVISCSNISGVESAPIVSQMSSYRSDRFFGVLTAKKKKK